MTHADLVYCELEWGPQRPERRWGHVAAAVLIVVGLMWGWT